MKQYRHSNKVYPLSYHANKPKAITAPTPHTDTIKKSAVLVMLIIALWSIMLGNAAAQPSQILNSPKANALYSDLLKNPTDRSLNLRYSTMMSQAGDYEAAIPPLERLLVTEPNNAWLMLQLGRLYQALDSKTIAMTYLKQAVGEPTASDKVISKAQQLMQSM